MDQVMSALPVAAFLASYFLIVAIVMGVMQ